MNRKYLASQGFTPEQIETIMAEHARTIAGYVPKGDHDTLQTKLKEFDGKTIVDPKELESLRTNAGKVAGLETQVATLKAQSAGIQKQADAKLALVTAKAKDPDLLLGKLDLEKDLAPQLADLQKSHPYMFGDPVPNTPNPNPAGGDPNAAAQEAEIAAFKTKVDAMNF